MAYDSSPATTSTVKVNRNNSLESIETLDSEHDQQKTGIRNEDNVESNHCERHSVFEDVTIPTNILRYVKPEKEWAPETGLVGTQDHHRADSSPTFNVLDIALEQQAAIDDVLGNASASQARRTSRSKSTWEQGQAVNWRHTSLPVFDEEKQDVVPRLQRRSASGKRAVPATRRRSMNILQGNKNASVLPQMDDTVLFRSLQGYALHEAAAVRSRRYSSAVPPDADFLATYEGSLEKDIDQHISDEALHASKDKIEIPPDASMIRRASLGMASLYQTVTRGTTNLMRMTTLRDAYENAKIRGKYLQRKKWVQVVFEYTFYLILLSFVYFVLVGVPLWKGAVWWLYWLVHTHFTVAGTWSITIGLAIM